MNPNDFEQLREAVQSVFSALYLIDVEKLTVPQRRQHQHTLSAAYLALVNAENAQFVLLSDTAKQQLAELIPPMLALQQGVSGLVTSDEKLSVVSKGVDALARLARLL